MVAAISLFVFPVLITRMFFYVRNARKQRELFLHGIFSNEHGKTRRCTDAGLFCTNLTNDTNVILYTDSLSLTNTDKHGGSRRVLYESHESQEYYLCTKHGELTEGSFYTDDSFYTDYINEHGTARRTRMLFCPVRISRI